MDSTKGSSGVPGCAVLFAAPPPAVSNALLSGWIASLLVLGSLGSFGLLDALDIAVVALGIYAAVGWLRRSRAALVGAGIVLIALLYAMPRSSAPASC